MFYIPISILSAGLKFFGGLLFWRWDIAFLLFIFFSEVSVSQDLTAQASLKHLILLPLLPEVIGVDCHIWSNLAVFYSCGCVIRQAE